MSAFWNHKALLALLPAVAASLVGNAVNVAQAQAMEPQVEVEVEYVEPGLGTVQPTQPGLAEVEVIIDDSARATPVGVFSCAEVPTPTTVFFSPEGSLPVIYWVSDYFTHSGWDPLTRCYAVSSRFQRFFEEGTLNYITTGIVNRLPVVCVASEMGGPCRHVLLTLKPGENASFVVQRLFDLSYGNRVGALYETDSRLYIDFRQYLAQLGQR